MLWAIDPALHAAPRPGASRKRSQELKGSLVLDGYRSTGTMYSSLFIRIGMSGRDITGGDTGEYAPG